MQDTQPVQVQIETQGAVPEGMPELAIAKVRSLLRLAAEPVLFARVTLTMAADPAVNLPAVARVNVDLDGRLVRARPARRCASRSSTWQAGSGPAGTLGTELGSPAREQADAPGEWRHQSIPAAPPVLLPAPCAKSGR